MKRNKEEWPHKGEKSSIEIIPEKIENLERSLNWNTRYINYYIILLDRLI